MKRHAFLTILGTACVVTGFSSYRIGRDRVLAASVPGEAQAKEAAQSTIVPAEAVSSRSPAELLSLKEKLKHSYAACPSMMHDWILRGQTAAVLATMTTAELQGLFDEFTARLRAGHVVKMGEPDMILASDILREWGRKDPVAACMRIADLPRYTDGRMAAFQDWLLRDPRAVEHWMNSGGDVVPADLRKAWLSERVKSDPHDAIQQLTKLKPEQREASLLEWSTSFALLPDERKALLESVSGDPAMLKKCAGRIVDALADRSVEEAYAFVDSLDPDEETATSLDDRIFVKWGMSDPQVAFAEWAKQQQTRLPENFFHVLANWSMNSPGAEQAIKWMDTVEAGPVKEKIQIHFIEDLASGDRLDQAVRMAMSMDNREEGKRQVMRVVARWKEKFPGDEKEWTAILREGGVEIR